MATKSNKSKPTADKPLSGPKPKFQMLGKSKYVHVLRSKAFDLKHSGCQTVRKYTVAEKIDYKKGLSPEAALALDACEACDAKAVAESLIPDDVKREERRDKRDDTMKRAKESTQTKAQAKKKVGKVKVSSDKAAVPKPRKDGATTMRSVGGDSRSKAEALGAFAKEHDWEVSIDDANPGLVLTAVRGAETIKCYFIDGKYDTSRHASVTTGNWTGKLRGVHGCRKQMAGEGRDKPHPAPGKGRSGPRRKVEDEMVDEEQESPEDARRRVPFSLDDDEIIVLDAIKGKIIKWRNSQTGTVEEAWLPADPKGKKRDKIKIVTHPKSLRRIVNFLTVVSINEQGEQYGAERSVYLDKIIRVMDS